jgi:hypothetical protein
MANDDNIMLRKDREGAIDRFIEIFGKRSNA